MKNNRILKVIGREVIDSRGNPTVEADVILFSGVVGRAIVPSGASTGKYEAIELRDNNSYKYFGKGVNKAVENINSIIQKKLQDKDINDLSLIDETIINIDTTVNKAQLGANATLSVSMAAYRANSLQNKEPLFKTISNGKTNKYVMPIPMLNVINGGAHANNNIDIQEFMIVPINFSSFREAFRASVEVYHSLKELLLKDGHSISVGDEGGFAPMLNSNEDALEYLLRAIKIAGYKAGVDFKISLDAASSEWKSQCKGIYHLPKSKKVYTSDQLIDYWCNLCEKYPILSIEDGLDEEDYDGWKKLTTKLGEKVMLVGDDLFVTNPKRLQNGIDTNIANSILIKPNQIGTIKETLKTIEIAKKANYNIIISHRSGESEDTFISHLAVGTNAMYIKSGAPCRSERVAKYNELLRIEEQL